LESEWALESEQTLAPARYRYGYVCTYRIMRRLWIVSVSCKPVFVALFSRFSPCYHPLLDHSLSSLFFRFVLDCVKLFTVVHSKFLLVYAGSHSLCTPLSKKTMVQIHTTSPNIIQTSSELWRSGSACDSSIRDIHKVIRSNRVSFIVPANHESSFTLFFPSSRASWASESHRERWAAGALSFCSL
jgi:hypothetical protein